MNPGMLISKHFPNNNFFVAIAWSHMIRQGQLITIDQWTDARFQEGNQPYIDGSNREMAWWMDSNSFRKDLINLRFPKSWVIVQKGSMHMAHTWLKLGNLVKSLS